VYPTVEIVVAAGFVAVVAVHGVSLLAVFLVYLVMISAALVVIDARHRRLPDALVLPALMVGAVAVVAHAALTQEWFIVARAASGAAILGGYYFVLWWVQPKGLGFGDVKTAGLLGLALGALGWAPLAVGAVLGPLLGGLAAMGAMLRHRRLRGLRIAYGPWLITGAWVGVLVGDSVWAGYFAAVSSWT
jgi:leader peptidase (prepilin peptidase)/N-methyltransferase